MDDGPAVLGINRTQDASACLMRGSTLQWAIQKERLSRIKHHWGRPGDVRDFYAARLPGLDTQIDVLVECYSSDAEIDNLAAYEQELDATLTLSPYVRRARISHHVAHLYSAFHPSPFTHAAVMVIDGQGSAVADFTEQWAGAADVPGDWREVSSFYVASRDRIACIDKQLWQRDEQQPAGLGTFYFMLTQAIFPGEGNEGKVMGLAPFGDPHALEMPPLEVDGCQVFMPDRWHALLAERQRFRYAKAGGGDFADIANLAAAGQYAFEEALLQVARWLHSRTGVDQLCFAGGTALNCSVNERLLCETPFRSLFIPPTPGDGGTALGCAVYGLTELAERRCDFRWRDDIWGRCRIPPTPRRRCTRPTICWWSDTTTYRRCARAWLICWPTTRRWRCSRAAANSGRARWGIAAFWPTRAASGCATGSMRGSSSASGSGRWRRWYWRNAPASIST